MASLIPKYRRARLWRHNKTKVFYLVWRENGGPKRKSLGTKSLVQAERKMQGILARAASPADSEGPITVHRAAAAWIEHKRSPAVQISKGTLNEYIALCGRLCEFWDEAAELENITTQHIYAFLSFLEEKHELSRTGIKKRLGLLKSFLKYHRDIGNLTRNPAGPVQLRGARPQHTLPLPEGQFPALLADLDEFAANAVKLYDAYARTALRDAVVVLRYSGLRSIDVFRVKWSDIDMEAGAWTIRRPENKGGTRTWPIHSAALAVLESRWGNDAEGPFPSPSPIRARWAKFRTDYPTWAGYTLHSLRFAFVTALQEAGLEWAAMQLAGHRTEAMSAHYTRSQMGRLRDALNELPTHAASPSPEDSAP